MQHGVVKRNLSSITPNGKPRLPALNKMSVALSLILDVDYLLGVDHFANGVVNTPDTETDNVKEHLVMHLRGASSIFIVYVSNGT